MKKIICIAAIISAIGFVSCSKNDVIDDTSDSNAIKFGTYLGQSPTTKADEDPALTALKASTGIGVFAYYNSNNVLMTNTQIAWGTAGPWDYKNPADVKYWSSSESDTYTFYAYAPYVEGKTLATGATTIGVAEADYKDASSNVLPNTDILVAVAKSGTRSGVTTQEGQVSFTFKHAKAKLKVKAVAAETLPTGTTISVSSVEIGSETNGFYTGGNINLNLAADAGNVTNKVEWSGQTGNTSSARTLSYSTVNNNAFTEEPLVVPGTYSALPVTVKYTLTQGSVEYANQTVLGTLESFTLEGSTAYILTVKVGLDKIEFTVDEETGVAGWGTESQIPSN